jgi:branched-subunit amino acid aminotransferase/4-amino-4-deoxychorismate lyase
VLVTCDIRLNSFLHSPFFTQLKEVFGSGTACVVCPVNAIQYLDEVSKVAHCK